MDDDQLLLEQRDQPAQEADDKEDCSLLTLDEPEIKLEQLYENEIVVGTFNDPFGEFHHDPSSTSQFDSSLNLRSHEINRRIVPAAAGVGVSSRRIPDLQKLKRRTKGIFCAEDNGAPAPPNVPRSGPSGKPKRRKKSNLSGRNDAIRAARNRRNQTPEQREKRLAKLRANQRRRISNETPEQRAERLAKNREYSCEKRQSETPQQRAERLAKMSESQRQRRLEETPAERAQRLAKNRVHGDQRLKKETQEERYARLAAMREYEKRTRAAETPEEAELRRARKAKARRLGQAAEPPLKRHLRLQRNRELRDKRLHGGSERREAAQEEQMNAMEELIRQEEEEEKKFIESYKIIGDPNAYDTCSVCLVKVQKKDMGLHLKYHAEVEREKNSGADVHLKPISKVRFKQTFATGTVFAPAPAPASGIFGISP